MNASAQAFSIHFHSLNLPCSEPEDKAIWESISAEGRELLETFSGDLDRKMASARDPERWYRRLHGSVFACCIPDGYVMLLAQPDARQRTVDFTGFLLRTDESLRTAWRLTRWQLLFLCASEWNYIGTVAFSPEEINQFATAVQFSQPYQKRLLAIGMEMMRADVPYSFAMTDCPMGMLSLQFSGTHRVSDAGDVDGGADGNAIYLAAEDVRWEQAALQKQYVQFDRLQLICVTQKQYVSLKMQEGMDSEQQKQKKLDAKNLLAAYHSDDVWCFHVRKASACYTELLNPITNAQLEQGIVEFSDLHSVLPAICAHAAQHFHNSPPKAVQAEQKTGLFHRKDR